ncbi:CAP domain-containing protein [Paenibacillus sp. GCM10027626]|uniref:CAP domain-containing protein n=1 Tax=Paenibacillus sp. GCM10027626 TaxID=3273411 RepID=UPI00363F90C7
MKKVLRIGVTAAIAAGMIMTGSGAFGSKAEAAAGNPISVLYKADAGTKGDLANKLGSQLGIDLSQLDLSQLLGGKLSGGQWCNQMPQMPQKPSVPSVPTTPSKPAPAPTTPSKPAPETGNGNNNGGEVAQSEFAAQVVKLVNAERAKAGLSALTTDALLTKVAYDKAKDMYDNNYFDHNSPTYGSPFDMMNAYGVQYNAAGENIAKGQRSPEEVMNAWMNSDGHRKNIMNSMFNKIGVAYYNGEWVQEFTS